MTELAELVTSKEDAVQLMELARTDKTITDDQYKELVNDIKEKYPRIFTIKNYSKLLGV